MIAESDALRLYNLLTSWQLPTRVLVALSFLEVLNRAFVLLRRRKALVKASCFGESCLVLVCIGLEPMTHLLYLNSAPSQCY